MFNGLGFRFGYMLCASLRSQSGFMVVWAGFPDEQLRLTLDVSKVILPGQGQAVAILIS